MVSNIPVKDFCVIYGYKASIRKQLNFQNYYVIDTIFSDFDKLILALFRSCFQ